MQSTYTVVIESLPGSTPLRPVDFARPFVGVMGQQSKRDLQEYVRRARAANARTQRLEA